MAIVNSFQLLTKLPQPEKLAQALVLFLLATIPLIFGAVHPIVQAAYTFLILVGLGAWLLYAEPELSWKKLSSFWLAVPIILMSYMVLQSLPLPLSVVEFVSPARAIRINMVNRLAGTQLTAASISDNGIIGLQNAIFVFSLLLYYFTLITLFGRNRKFIKGLLYVVAGVGIFEAVYGLLQMMNPGAGILWLPIISKGAAHGSIIYKNQYASLLNMCWPLTLAGGLIFLEPLKEMVKRNSQKSKVQDFLQSLSLVNIQAPLFFFATGAMILAVLFSLSRGGILVMLLLLVLLNLFLPPSRKIKLFLTILLLVFLGGYGSLVGLDEVFRRFNTIDNSGLTRLHLYISSLPLLVDHWLTGIGFGSFRLLSGVYLKGFPENLLFDRAHNDYLELAIELGLPMAALFFVWLLSGIIGTGKKMLQKSRGIHDGHQKTTIVGCAAFCSLLGFLIHGLVDFGWRLPVNALYAVTLLALISYTIRDSARLNVHQSLDPGFIEK